MSLKINGTFYESLSKNRVLLFITTLFFAIGIAAGAFTVKSLDANQKQELIVYFNRFLQIVGKTDVSRGKVFYQSVKNNLQTVLLLWLFGMTIVGVITTPIIIAFKGFVTGFTISFLIQGLGWKGILACIIAVLPQNIIYVPCIIIISAESLCLSVRIIRKKTQQNYLNDTKNMFLQYTMTIAVLFVIMILGSIIEAYISPYIMKSLSSFFLK